MPDLAGPSETARRVAAYRLGFERVAIEGGDPGSDDRLAADVAADVTVDRSGPMDRYLQARTRFFDRVVVNALGRHVAQIVVIGAGYDGRALRYRSPGVRWWEVDRHRTQRDKQSRLERLGISTDGVTFVALDLSDGGLAAALVAASFEPDAPALFVLEGVAAYLDAETLRQVLGDLRSLATPGTRLAMSLRRPGTDSAARARFEATVAALGEPAVGSMSAEVAAPLLAGCRWRPVELNERATAAGFAMAAPVFEPAATGVAPTVGRIGLFIERMLYCSGGETLAAHLEDVYGVPVAGAGELDHGVHRVQRVDGSTWIARVFPASRSLDAVREDAELLAWLRKAGIPVERLAAPDPVSLHEGQAVLVTEFAPGHEPPRRPASFERLGALLARIHTLPADALPANRPGGAWHHLLFDATVSEELAAAAALLHDARHRVPRGGAADYDRLVEALDLAWVPPDLPAGVVHPDFVSRNLLQADDGSLTVVDWSGAGLGARLVSLGCLLWSVAGHGPSLDAAARGYSSKVALEPVELDHLPAAMAVRPAILACWTFATGRSPVADTAAWWANEQRKLSLAAGRAGDQMVGTRGDRRSPRGGAGRNAEAARRDPLVSTGTGSAGGPAAGAMPIADGVPGDLPAGGGSATAGELVTEVLGYDGGRLVTAYVPGAPPEAIVFAGDGELIPQWAATLEAADAPSTMIVGVHRLADETLRLHEYSPGFDPVRFAAHEAFFVEQVRRWVRENFEVALPAERTAVFGVSAGGELALALGLRHPDVYGAVFCASPGGGYKPPAEMPSSPPRTYLVAGTSEPFFRDNATRWAAALRDAGAEVVMTERMGSHGGAFWREELPLMVKWAFLR
jgi:methyltransferase (TIGR00027 family)